MRRRLLKGLPVFAAGLLMLAIPRADAGWVIEQVDTDFPGEGTVYYIDGARVRVEGLVPELVILLDLQAGEGFILDESRGRYGGGKLSKIEAVMHRRRAGSAGRSGETAPGEGEEGSRAALPDLRIERIPDAGRVAGFESARYRILLGEELVEEIWIAPAVTALAGGAISSLISALDIMTGGTSMESRDFPPGYDKHPDYLEVLHSGFPVRRTLYFIGESNTDEVRSAAKKNLPGSLFDIPGEMEKIRYPDYLNLFLGRD